MSFQCAQCYKEGRPALVRLRSNQFVIEVAAKSADGQQRAKQTSTLTFCREHAERYVLLVAAYFRRHRELPPEFLGHQGSFFDEDGAA